MPPSVPELMDLPREPQHVLDAHGADPSKAGVANQCLLARRLVERGVRFAQLNFGNWDAHQQIYKTMPKMCQQIDQPAAALNRDLKQRGLLDSTLIVWSGEFGRTPMVRDVSPDGMSYPSLKEWKRRYSGGAVPQRADLQAESSGARQPARSAARRAAPEGAGKTAHCGPGWRGCASSATY